MKLPNPDKLVVERDKIADYLLNPVHRFGASKARFFTHFGFHAEAWEQLAQALREHGQKHDVTKMRETGFGPRYEVEGRLNLSQWPPSACANGLATGRRGSCAAPITRVSFGG